MSQGYVARIGLIGCGNISEAYLMLSKLFAGLEIVAVADLVPAAAAARAKQFSVRALSVDEMLKDDDIDAIVNLTVPNAHFAVSLDILSAGKHAYCEKPLSLNYADARRLADEADGRGLKLGAAPDTFLGGASQTARKLLDAGTIGRVIAGTAHVMGHGMEHWHPNPAFFYQPGGGPIFDMAPYYLAMLINLIGPVEAVTAVASKGFDHRIVTAPPNSGERIEVTTPTSINAVLEFRSGAQVTLGASWDVWRHGHQNPIELYGAEGTMLLPDPNFFSGSIACSKRAGDYEAVDSSGAAFGVDNWPPPPAKASRANYRMLGVADLIDAAAHAREPRCSGRLAAHIVEIMESILASAAERRRIALASTVERPAPLGAEDAERLIGKPARKRR
jgi:predicted dehydrogenase